MRLAFALLLLLLATPVAAQPLLLTTKEQITLKACFDTTGAFTLCGSSSSSGAPADGSYIVRTPESALSNETALSTIGNGLMQIDGAGMPSVYAGSVACTSGDFVTGINADGTTTCATPIPLITGGPFAAGAIVYGGGASALASVAITGLVQGNGASPPTAFAGSACGAGTFAASISAAGVLTCGSPSGSGTVTNSGGALALNAFVLGAGGSDIKAQAITGLVLGQGATAPTAYAGTSCTNQFPRSLDANGAATCASVALASDVTGVLGAARGGTGIDSSGLTGLPSIAAGVWSTYSGSSCGAATLPTSISSAGALGCTGTPTVSSITATTGTVTTLTVGNLITFNQAAIQVGPYGFGAGNTGELRLYELTLNGTNFIGFKAPDSLAADRIIVPPAVVGAAGSCLVTDGGSPVETWSYLACGGGGAGTITSLNGLTVAVQTFVNDTNVGFTSSGSTHTVTWTGQLGNTRGGTGQNSSAWNNLVRVSGGTWQQYGGMPRNVALDSATSNGQSTTVCGMIAGAAIVSCTSATFSAGDVGKYLFMQGAGASGANYVSQIIGFTSATQVTMLANAGTTVSAASAPVTLWGTDDTAAIDAALVAGYRWLVLPKGTTWANPTSKAGLGPLRITGEGTTAAIFSTFATDAGTVFEGLRLGAERVGMQTKDEIALDVLPTVASTGVAGKVRYWDVAGTKYLSFKAPSALPASIDFTWPLQTPTAGQAMLYGGGGLLNWTDVPEIIGAPLSSGAFYVSGGGKLVTGVSVTGLVLGAGAGGPTAYAGTSCGGGTVVTGLNASGAATCSAGSTVTGSGTANRMAIWTSSTALGAVGAMTNGQLLIGNTGFAPVPASLTCTGSITCTPGAGTLTLNVAAGGGTATGLTTSTFAGLPAASGGWGPARLVTDNVRGLFLDMGTQWYKVGGYTVNVKEFGAKGDGVTVDTAAFAAAAAAIPTSGGTLYIPAGIYQIDNTITFSNPTIVRGDGARGCATCGGSMIRTTSATLDVFSCTGQSCTFRDLGFTSSISRSAGAMIRISNAGSSKGAVIDGIVIDSAHIGIHMGSTNRWSIVNSWITVASVLSGAAAIWYNDLAFGCDEGGVSIANVQMNGPGHNLGTNNSAGILMTAGGGISVTNSSAFGFGWDVRMRPDASCTSTALSEFQFANNDFSGFTHAAIQMATPSPSTGLSGIKITNTHMTTISGVPAGATAIEMSGNVTGVQIVNNSIGSQGTGDIGIRAIVTAGVPQIINITGNQIIGFDTAIDLGGAANALVSGNLMLLNTNDVVNVNGSGSKVLDVTSSFSALPTTVGGGSMYYCFDCDPPLGYTATCTSAGAKTGSPAIRIGGAWKC